MRGDLYSRCPGCGFEPSSDEDYAKCLILSDPYEVAGWDRTWSPQQLAAAREQIRAGTFAFDPVEVSEVAAWFAQVEQDLATLTKSQIALDLFTMFAPLLAGFSGLAALLLFLRSTTLFAQPKPIPWLLFAGLLLVFAAGVAGIARGIRNASRIDHAARAEFWLAEPRAVTVEPAVQALAPSPKLPADVTALFSRFERIRIRFSDLELSADRIADTPGHARLVTIGTDGANPVAVDAGNGKLYVIDGNSRESLARSVAALIDSECSDRFSHLDTTP